MSDRLFRKEMHRNGRYSALSNPTSERYGGVPKLFNHPTSTSDREHWSLTKWSISTGTVSQHDALHVTVQHLVVMDLTQLPVELSLFLGPPAVDVFSQCNALNTGQMGQHVIWQGRHTRARQIQLLQGV